MAAALAENKSIKSLFCSQLRTFSGALPPKLPSNWETTDTKAFLEKCQRGGLGILQIPGSELEKAYSVGIYRKKIRK